MVVIPQTKKRPLTTPFLLRYALQVPLHIDQLCWQFGCHISVHCGVNWHPFLACVCRRKSPLTHNSNRIWTNPIPSPSFTIFSWRLPFATQWLSRNVGSREGWMGQEDNPLKGSNMKLNLQMSMPLWRWVESTLFCTRRTVTNIKGMMEGNECSWEGITCRCGIHMYCTSELSKRDLTEIEHPCGIYEPEGNCRVGRQWIFLWCWRTVRSSQLLWSNWIGPHHITRGERFNWHKPVLTIC